MTTIRRFFYVGSKARQAKIHRCFGSFVEGERTVCGLFLSKGWLYWLGRRNVPSTRRHCKKCEAAS